MTTDRLTKEEMAGLLRAKIEDCLDKIEPAERDFQYYSQLLLAAIEVYKSEAGIDELPLELQSTINLALGKRKRRNSKLTEMVKRERENNPKANAYHMAREFGVSRERIRQILVELGLPTKV